MEETKTSEEIDAKIITVNEIMEEVVTDTRELIQDLRSGIIMYYIMGIQCVLMGFLNIWTNRHYIADGDSLSLLLSALLILTGPYIIYQGYILRKKYTRLFEAGQQLTSG